MIKDIINRKSLKVIILLAIFNFCFLGTEYFFDEMMMLLTDSSGVVNAQNIVLGVSFIGFAVYAFIDRILSAKLKKFIGAFMTIVCITCVFIMKRHTSYSAVLGAGILCFIFLGVAGSASCYYASQLTKNYRHMGKTVGISYALGIFIQFINNNLIHGVMSQAITISVFMIFWGVYITSFTDDLEDAQLHKIQKEDAAAFYGIRLENPKMALTALIFCVVFMTAIFSALDNAVTLVHASGTFNIGQWPRLWLAVSGIAAGFLYDMKQRWLMPIEMYLVTLLSVVSIVVVQMGGPFLIGLLVFYISAGFFVVFFMTGFMDLSFQMKEPRLWAGMGRGINNLVAIILSALSVSLLEMDHPMFIMIAALVLFVLISCSVIAYYKPFADALKNRDQLAVREETIQELTKERQMEKIDAFALQHNFTQREKEVLIHLLTSKEGVGAMAKQLAMSRANFYRYINKMNEKTKTGSRMELIQYFYGWES